MINTNIVISPSGDKLSLRHSFEIIRKLQHEVRPDIFSLRGVYDGRKNFFTTQKLEFGESAEVRLSLHLFVHVLNQG